MPSMCIVHGCSNTHKDGVIMHKFPADPKYRSIWTDKLQQHRARQASSTRRRSTSKLWLSGPSYSTLVCSHHFEPDCYYRGLYSQFGLSRKPLLLKDAIPTIFTESKETEPSGEPSGAFQKRERISILHEARRQTSTSEQDAFCEETNNTSKEVNIPTTSIIHVCEKDNYSEGTLHPLQKTHQDNENTLHARQNVQEECPVNNQQHIQNEEFLTHKPPSNIAELEDVWDSSDKGDQCLSRQHQGQSGGSLTHRAPVNVKLHVEEVQDSSAKIDLHSAASNQQHGHIKGLALEHKSLSNIVQLEEVMDLSEKGDQCLAIDGQYHRQNSESLTNKAPSNIAKQTDLSEFIYILIPTITHVNYVYRPPTNNEATFPCSIAPCSDRPIASKENLKNVKIETGDQCPAHNEQQEDIKGENVFEELRSNLGISKSDLMKLELMVEDDNKNGVLQTNIANQDNQTQHFYFENIDQTSEDGRNAEMTEEEEEEEDEDEGDDNLEMDDHSSDQDYVPDIRVHVSKQKKKQRGRTLRPRRACQTASSYELAQPLKKDTDAEEHSSESSAEDNQDNKLLSDEEEDNKLSSAEEDLLSSSEDSDEQAEKRRQKKKYTSTYVRLEVQFSRLPKMYECKTCREQFQEAEDMRRHHTESHSKEQTDMPDADQQELHAVNVPSDSDMAEIATELRQCKKCKEYVKNIQDHHRIHVHRKFLCEMCGKMLKARRSFDTHRLVVHEFKANIINYKCKDCNKSYASKGGLYRHKAVHYNTGGKHFICEECGKQFKRMRSFKIHQLIHLKEKPFKCSQCGRGFSQKSNMTLHMRTHTGARPYQCNVCMEAFNHNVSLKTHQKKAHGIDWWKDKNNGAVS